MGRRFGGILLHSPPAPSESIKGERLGGAGKKPPGSEKTARGFRGTARVFFDFWPGFEPTFQTFGRLALPFGGKRLGVDSSSQGITFAGRSSQVPALPVGGRRRLSLCQRLVFEISGLGGWHAGGNAGSCGWSCRHCRLYQARFRLSPRRLRRCGNDLRMPACQNPNS